MSRAFSSLGGSTRGWKGSRRSLGVYEAGPRFTGASAEPGAPGFPGVGAPATFCWGGRGGVGGVGAGDSDEQLTSSPVVNSRPSARYLILGALPLLRASPQVSPPPPAPPQSHPRGRAWREIPP